MKRDIRLRIQDILENMQNAEQFVGSMSFEEFCGDMKTSYAVVRCLEIVGEATKHIPEAIRRKHPEIPWKEMAGMRDSVSHEYFGVDLEVVWLVVRKEIPRLKLLVGEVLEGFGSK